MRIGAPSSGRRNPPRAGPTIPERFNCTPPSVIAEGSSSLLTISGTTAPQTGAPKASPIPSAKIQASTALGLIVSVNAPNGKNHRPSSLPQHRTDDDRAPVDDVGNRAGRQREQKERSRCRRRHQGEPKRRRAKIVHQPRRRNILRRNESTRQKSRQPQPAKDRISKGEPR